MLWIASWTEICDYSDCDEYRRAFGRDTGHCGCGGDCRRYFRWLGRSVYPGAFRDQEPDCPWFGFGFRRHGLGTAKAMELGAVEGAISGLAIGVMGIMTAILVPVIELFIG